VPARGFGFPIRAESLDSRDQVTTCNQPLWASGPEYGAKQKAEAKLPRDSDNLHIVWERALERRGVESVRLLLRIGSGHDADVAFQGLVSEPPYPPRSFVEHWVATRDSSSGKIGRSLLWPILLLIVAVGILAAAIGMGEFELPRLGWF